MKFFMQLVRENFTFITEKSVNLKKKPMALATMFKVLFLIKSKLTLLFPYIKKLLDTSYSTYTLRNSLAELISPTILFMFPF